MSGDPSIKEQNMQKGKPMGNLVDIFVFYHNEQKLLEAKQSKEDLPMKFVNLNEIELPKAFVVNGLSETLNRAIFSEYLGILAIEPDQNAKWVGCFTYSVPVKFSSSWAWESGADVFFPPVRLHELERLPLESGHLYGVEFSNPLRDVPEEVLDIHAQFPQSEEVNVGPYKGSFVVERDVFLKLQDWLRDVTSYVLAKYPLDATPERHSQFDDSETASRSAQQRDIDKLRHKLGFILERAVAYFLGAQYENSCHVKIGQRLHEVAAETDLVKRANSLAIDKQIIVVFADKNYTEVIAEWAKRIKGLGVENYLVVAQDPELHESNLSKSINSVLVPFTGSLERFWIHRLERIQTLMEAGLDVLHSDADAFWVRDCRKIMKDYAADIIASQGTIFPDDVAKEWGFVLCCGLVQFRSNRRSLAFFEKVLSCARDVKDDQVALNRALADSSMNWNVPQEHEKYILNDQRFFVYKAPVHGSNRFGVTVTLIPHQLVQRMPGNYSPDVAVLHLLSKKQNESKFDALRDYETAMSNTKLGKPNVVWLASYPRSGNTLMRTILKNNFGVNTYSLYNDSNDIGKDPKLREFVGHVDGDWEVMHKGIVQYPRYPERLYEKAKEKTVVIKTHSQFCDFYKGHKAILVVRDPRPALVSEAHFIKNFVDQDGDIRKILSEQIAVGDPSSGFWSDHTNSWLEKCEDLLILRFEDLINEFEESLSKISVFLRMDPTSRELEDFSKFQSVNKNFFRQGKKNTWSETLSVADQYLIRMSCENTAKAFGYDLQEPGNEAFDFDPHLGRVSKRGKPWIYIVTPSYNSKDTISQTIQSVLTQAGDFYLRYHIQDGGSTDGTVELLRDWERKITDGRVQINCKNVVFSFESKPDKGMYDAINKGFSYMNVPDFGICSYINADDFLFQGAASTVGKIFAEVDDVDWIVPNKCTVGETFNHRARDAFTPNQWSIRNGLCDGKNRQFLQQEGMFWTYRVWREVGGFDQTLKFAGDWDLWRRFAELVTPYYTRHVYGAFRRREGQLSENWISYQSEVDGIIDAKIRAKNKKTFDANKDAQDVNEIVFKDGQYVRGITSAGTLKSFKPVLTTREMEQTEVQTKIANLEKERKNLEIDRDYILSLKQAYKSVATSLIEELRHISPELQSAYEKIQSDIYDEKISFDHDELQKFISLARKAKENIIKS